ncbi:MAG: hypothetical protein UT63_C0018G0017, partial [Candidatus Gottesmanbacteria bacterium GW2011_GWC2_39_8]
EVLERKLKVKNQRLKIQVKSKKFSTFEFCLPCKISSEILEGLVLLPFNF